MITQYKKSVDKDGVINSLYFQEEDRVIIFQPIAKADGSGFEVNMVQVSSTEDMAAYVGGNTSECQPEEWNETLFVKWGFSGSVIYCAQIAVNLEDNNDNTNTRTEQDAPIQDSELEHSETECGEECGTGTDSGLVCPGNDGTVSDLESAGADPCVRGASSGDGEAEESKKDNGDEPVDPS